MRNRNEIKFWILSRVFDIGTRIFALLLKRNPFAAVARQFSGKANARVLDLCTGTALCADRIARMLNQGSVVGLDLSSHMLRRAREKAESLPSKNLRLVQGTAEQLPFPDQTFTGVSVSFGLHELPLTVRRRAIREVGRVLAPGGEFVVVDLDRPSWAPALADFYVRLAEPSDARLVLGDGLVNEIEQSAPQLRVQCKENLGFGQLILCRKSP